MFLCALSVDFVIDRCCRNTLFCCLEFGLFSAPMLGCFSGGVEPG
jgi:hypothetical protein